MTAKTKKTLGIVLIAAPIPALFLNLVAYAISSFVISSIVAGGGASDLATLIGNIISVVLGFIGIVCVAGILIGIPLGIVLLVTAGEDKTKPEEVNPKVEKLEETK